MEALKKITKEKTDEKVPYLEIIDVILDQCNVVNNNYQQYSRVLCTLVPNESFVKLIIRQQITFF